MASRKSKLTCPICGNDEFDEQDGHFFCTECSTQSQHFHVEEAEDLSFQNISQNMYQKKVPSQKARQTSHETKEGVLGRPWTIYEAYQYIIMAQVDSLIALGASEHLKDVAYSVWANYLRKLGVAFCSHEKLVPDIVLQTGCFRPRELNRGSFENPKNRVREKRKSKRNDDDAELGLPREEEVEEESEMVFLNGPVPAIEKSGKPMIKGPRTARWQAAVNSPEWMDLKKTITICYIGLMITDPHFMPHDIIRWAYEGKIPLLSCTHVLPDDIVLSARDSRLFTLGNFSSRQLRKELSKLLFYLSLDDIPQVGVDTLIPRFVDELALPNDLKIPCLRLLSTFPMHYWSFSEMNLFFRSDIMALAYIITSLVMVLAVDGTTETQLSDCSKKLQSILQADPPLFVWEDWKLLIRNRFHRQFNSCVEFNQPIEKSEGRHVESFVKCYKHIGRSARKLTTSELNIRMNWTHRNTPDFVEGLCNPLELALERCSVNDINTESEKRRREEDQRLESFKKSTLCHIMDAEIFARKYSEQVQSGGEDAHILLEFLRSRPKTFLCLTKNRPVKDTTSLEQPISWLVKLCCDMVGCAESQLNQAISSIQQCVYLKTTGQCAGDLKVTPNGARPQSERFKSKTHQAHCKQEVL